MRERRFRFIRNLLVYLMVIGMIFNYPVSHVSADGDEGNPVPVSMSFSWPEGKNGEVTVDVENSYDAYQIIDGGTLTVIYSDDSTKDYVFSGSYFINGDDELNTYVSANNWNTEWSVGTEDAKVSIEYYYDYNVDPLMLDIPITIVEDKEIVSWSDAKSAAVALANGTTINYGNTVSFIYSDYGNHKQKGTFFYVDVPYKKSISISTGECAEYSIFKESEEGPYMIQKDTQETLVVRNAVSESERYYISINPFETTATSATASLEVEDMDLFEDVKDTVTTLTEGKNIKLDEANIVNWVAMDGDFYCVYSLQIVRLIVPAGKAVRVTEIESDWSYVYLDLFGEDGNTKNVKHNIYTDAGIIGIDSVENGVLANDGISDIAYYFCVQTGITGMTISYQDFAAATVTIDPDFPEDMNKSEYEKEIETVTINKDSPCCKFTKDYYGYDQKYTISGWKDKDTGTVYPADWTFCPESSGTYNYKAVWTEKPSHTLTFKSNYPSEWGLTDTEVSEKVYEGSSVDIYKIGNKIPRKDGYKVVNWYYLDGEEKQYPYSSWIEPDEDMTFYGEWDETDEVKVTVHSNYPTNLGLEDVESFEYVDPSNYYAADWSFKTPEGYEMTGWKDQNGNACESSGYFDKNTDLYAQWKKLNKVTFHSNYPEVLGKEEETYEEYDWGDGVSTGAIFNADEWRWYVYIDHWSRTPGGESIGNMYDYFHPTEDTDLYACWIVPELQTYTFHSQYPIEWNKDDVTATMTEKFDHYININESDVPATITGENGAKIVGWEDPDGFAIYDHPTAFQGCIQYSNQDWYAVWSTRPTITIYTHFPSEYAHLAGQKITYYASRGNQFSVSRFNEAYSVEGYNCKLTDRATGKEYVIGYDDDQIQLSGNIVFDASWRPAESITIHTAYSDGSDNTEKMNCLWDGGYILPNYYYTDPVTGDVWTTDYYEDAEGNKYDKFGSNEIVQIANGSELWARFKFVPEVYVTYYCDYPGGTPQGYQDYYTQKTYNRTYSIDSSLRYSMATISGYTFQGWVDKNGNMVDESCTYGTDEDVVYHAVWKSNKKNGFVKEGNVWKYYVNGKVYKVDEKKGKTLVNGTIDGKTDWYKVNGNGEYDPTYIGIAQDTDKKWYFVSNGVKDITYTGIAQATNTIWYYVEKGVINRDFGGKIVLATNGKWYYVNKGKPTKTFTEKIAQTTDGTWYYCTNGRPDVKVSGIIAYCTTGDWYYVTKGKIDKKFTGVAKATNGSWYYCVKGKMNKTYTGIAKATNGKLYYVNKGKQDLKFKGIAKASDGKMYYVEKGEVNKSFTGNYKYNGKVYKVVKGVVK